MNKTFEECAEDKPQTIYFDRTFNDVRLIVMRGPEWWMQGINPG